MTLSSSVSAAKDRILIAGAGYMGQFVAEASLEAGRPTYILVRPFSGSPSKAKAIKALQDKGAVIIYGLIDDQKAMEKILKEHEIDIVIATIAPSILPQIPLVHAVKAVGTIKRFFPSEFGHDVDRAHPVEPGLTMYKEKRMVRRLVEELGIPYTYICCNSIASWPYYDNPHPSELLPPLDKFQIYGDGTGKAYFVLGTDIGKFTIKALDDDRTLNKTVHFRPPCNNLNMNELSALWEHKIGRTLPRETITAEDLLALARENRIPESIVAAFTHDVFITGCQVNFPIDGPNDVEVTVLYPNEPFQSMDDWLGDLVFKMDKKPVGAQGITAPISAMGA